MVASSVTEVATCWSGFGPSKSEACATRRLASAIDFQTFVDRACLVQLD